LLLAAAMADARLAIGSALALPEVGRGAPRGALAGRKARSPDEPALLSARLLGRSLRRSSKNQVRLGSRLAGWLARTNGTDREAAETGGLACLSAIDSRPAFGPGGWGAPCFGAAPERFGRSYIRRGPIWLREHWTGLAAAARVQFVCAARDVGSPGGDRLLSVSWDHKRPVRPEQNGPPPPPPASRRKEPPALV
jgi:hypothetical protein